MLKLNRNLFFIALFTSWLSACGGSGSGSAGGSTPPPSGGTTGGVFIAGNVITNAPALGGVNYNAAITVKNTNSIGLPITNATVTVNGTALVLEPLMKVYMGAVTPDSAGKFNLSVTANGTSYTASDAAITALPVVTIPAPFVASAANTVSWTTPTGAPASMKYDFSLRNVMGVVVFNRPNIAANSFTIPAATTLASSFYSPQLLGAGAGATISNAVTGSSFASAISMSPASFTSSAGIATLPAVPLGVTATTASATQINLAWTAVTGATGYNVYRASAAGVAINAANKITVAPVATASFSNTALTAATSYFYKVTAVSGAGESVGSAEVTATTSAGVVAPPVTPVAGLMGGAIQGTPLALSNSVTTSPWMTYLGEMTTDGTNFYIADRTFFRVTKFNPITGVQSTLAGAFTITPGFVDGTGAAAKFSALGGITTDGTNLYVADIGNHSIRKIVIATGVVTTLAGSGVAGFADGTGTAAQFNQPNGITTDNTNLFVADYLNNRIRKIVIATGVVTTLAGSGVATRVDGTGIAATFSNPYVLTTDGTYLYESDLFSGLIRKIVIATGVVTTMPSGGTGLAFTSDVRGITTDGTNLYIADNSGAKVVRKVVIATGVMSLIAGGGTAVTATVDGVGVAAKFSNMGAILTDGTSLYLVDLQLFRKIQ